MGTRLRPFVGVVKRMHDLESSLVPIVQQRIQQVLEANIPAMMHQKAGFELLLITKKSSEQADFFFDALMPHQFELSIKLLNWAEVAPRIIQQRAAEKMGHGRLVGHASGMVAKAVVSHAMNTQGNRLTKYIARKQG